jgi:hypothetical protein
MRWSTRRSLPAQIPQVERPRRAGAGDSRTSIDVGDSDELQVYIDAECIDICRSVGVVAFSRTVEGGLGDAEVAAGA